MVSNTRVDLCSSWHFSVASRGTPIYIPGLVLFLCIRVGVSLLASTPVCDLVPFRVGDLNMFGYYFGYIACGLWEAAAFSFLSFLGLTGGSVWVTYLLPYYHHYYIL